MVPTSGDHHGQHPIISIHTTTTHRYVEADLAMKEKALARLVPPDTSMPKFRAPDSLMRFLQTL